MNDPGGPELAQVSLRVNGEPQTLTLDTRTSLLDLLREQLDLTGRRRAATTASAARAPS